MMKDNVVLMGVRVIPIKDNSHGLYKSLCSVL